MKICLITSVNKAYSEIGDISLPNMQRYCERHGYAMQVGLYHTDPSRLDTYGDRGKIDLFNSMWTDYDAVMWLDVDSLVMNSAVRIEDVLGPRDFLWTYDVNGPCSGFWIARCVPSVHLALNTVKHRAPYSGNVRTVTVPGPPAKVVLEMEPTGQADQAMMVSLMNTPPYSHVFGQCVRGRSAGFCYDYDVVPWPPEYHYVNHYQRGDWLISFPSLPIAERIALMKQHAKEAT